MNTIKTYILNIFKSLPKTDELERLKEELIVNMQEKYEELKQLGKSESEAISIVISEFGDIDELLVELNINVNTSETNLEKSSIINYLNESKKSFRKLGYGIFLMFLAISVAYIMYDLIKNNLIFSDFKNSILYLAPIISSLILVIPSLYIIISEALNLEKLNKIKTIKYNLSNDAKSYLYSECELFKPKFTKGIISGIILVLSSSLSLVILNSDIVFRKSLAVFVALLLISIAVMIFINIGTYYIDLQFFVSTREYIQENEHVSKVLGAVAAFIFPITFLVCLLIVIFYKKWLLALVVFFAVSIVYSAFSGAYSTIKNK